MKRLLSLSLLGSSLLIGSNSVKADENYFLNLTSSSYGGDPTYEILKSSTSGDTTQTSLVTTFSRSSNDNIYLVNPWIDYSLNKIYFQENDSSNDKTGKVRTYSLTDNTWSLETLSSDSPDSDPEYGPIKSDSYKAVQSNSSSISTNSTNISSNDTDIASNATNISSNDTDIASNSSNISSNDTDIASNSSNISSNDTDIATNASNISSNDTDISALQGLISTKSGSTTTARIGDSTKNTLEIGPTTNPTTIDQSGISVSGGNLIKKDSDGNIHIGKNSFVIGDDVLNGAHPIWAEDENGTKIPLNIYGSDLHINGKSVQVQIDSNKSNIKNLGEGVAGSTALTAALTALPQTSKESKLSCGIGTGAYSSRYAVGFGCASKVSERVDINAGGSYVFGGSKSYGEGTLDSGVLKAGFVFKLGELNKPIQISMKDKKVMETKIETLEEKNKQLLARLERLEKIALGESNSPDLAVYQLK